MADDLVIRKPALYRYAVRLLVDVLYQMGCDMRQTFRVNDTDIHAWNHFTERYTSATEVHDTPRPAFHSVSITMSLRRAFWLITQDAKSYTIGVAGQ